MGSVPLKRIGGISKAAMILVGLTGLVGLLAALSSRASRSAAEDFLADRIDEDEFLDEIALFALMGVVQLVTLLASVVVVVIWMYRIAANHRTLHRTGTWGPGWAIGGWVLPPALHIIPYLMFRELWKASDPDTPLGANWRTNPVHPIVSIWFVLYGVLPLIVTISQGTSALGGLGTSTDSLAEGIVDGSTVDLLAGLLSLAGAIAFVLMARGLSTRHRRLTGETPS